jgi:hypothetical protein
MGLATHASPSHSSVRDRQRDKNADQKQREGEVIEHG